MSISDILSLLDVLTHIANGNSIDFTSFDPYDNPCPHMIDGSAIPGSSRKMTGVVLGWTGHFSYFQPILSVPCVWEENIYNRSKF